MEERELKLLLSTWFFWYTTWDTNEVLEEMYFAYLDTRPEDLLKLAVCFHKYWLPNDPFVEALACGKGEVFLAFVPDHVSECFASETEFEEEKARLIQELQVLSEIKGQFNTMRYLISTAIEY